MKCPICLEEHHTYVKDFQIIIESCIGTMSMMEFDRKRVFYDCLDTADIRRKVNDVL